MAILIVAGFTVPVQEASVEYDDIGGDHVRMFDGTMRSTVRARKRRWSVTTRLLTSGDRTSLITALQGIPPVACSGDVLGGSVNCIPVTGTTSEQWTTGQIRYRVSFVLHEQ